VPGADPAGRAELQATMSRFAGIGRDRSGLLAAQSTLRRLGGTRAPTTDRWSVETANLALAGRALLAAAAERAESRGCHVRNDHPERLAAWERSVLVRQLDGVLDVRMAAADEAVAWV
jgi:L-aspartate oxidase